MIRDIHIDVNDGIIHVTYRGDMEYAATTDMLRKVAAVASDRSLERVLLDVRDANYLDYHVSAIRHAEEAASLGIRDSYRIALLGALQNPMLDYLEAVATNRGLWLKAFCDEAQAIGWLRDQ